MIKVVKVITMSLIRLPMNLFNDIFSDKLFKEDSRIDNIKESFILFYENVYGEFKRYYQEKTRGYSDSDLWSLDLHIVNAIKDPVIEFCEKDLTSYPMRLTPTKWKNIRNKIAYSFKNYDLDGDNSFEMMICEKHNKKMDEGFKLFGKYFLDLWD